MRLLPRSDCYRRRMQTPKLIAPVAAAMLIALLAAWPAAAQTPNVTTQTLPTLGGPTGSAFSINSHGDIVGMSQTDSGTMRATLWSNGTVTDLGALCPACLVSIGFSINDHNQVVGYAFDANFSPRPVFYANGAAIALLSPAGYDQGVAMMINNSGQIAGYVAGADGVAGVLWASPTAAPQVTSLYAATALNDAGDMAGLLLNSCGTYQAAVSRNGVVEALESGGPCLDSMAWFINAAGLVAGTSLDGNGLSRATIWNGGARILNEPLPGFARSSAAALNASGDLVGLSGDPSYFAYPTLATVWLPEGTLALTPHPTGSGRDVSTGVAINAAAQVVGTSYDGNGFSRPTVWTIDVDRQPPAITINAPDAIFPPNGKMVPVTFAGSITDASGIASASFAVVDEYGTVQPSGRVMLDAGGNFATTVMLEARRNGPDRDGRTYTFTVTATDVKGLTGTGTATAAVTTGRK